MANVQAHTTTQRSLSLQPAATSNYGTETSFAPTALVEDDVGEMLDWRSRAIAADADEDDDIIVVDLKRESVVIDFTWSKEKPFREYRNIDQLTVAQKKDAPKYLKPADLRKQAIENWHPTRYKGKFSQYNHETKQLEVVVKRVGLWDFCFKLLAIFRPELASSKNHDVKTFMVSRICLNEGYNEGFCCRLAIGNCRCVSKCRIASHGINAAWICCKFNAVQCAIAHSVFHRHDLVTNCTERNDVAPSGYVTTYKKKIGSSKKQ